MDANSTYGDGTVQDRINQLSERRTEFQSLAQQADSLWKNLPEQDWISYHSRSATLGEEAALHWLVDKFAAKN